MKIFKVSVGLLSGCSDRPSVWPVPMWLFTVFAVHYITVHQAYCANLSNWWTASHILLRHSRSALQCNATSSLNHCFPVHWSAALEFDACCRGFWLCIVCVLAWCCFWLCGMFLFFFVFFSSQVHFPCFIHPSLFIYLFSYVFLNWVLLMKMFWPIEVRFSLRSTVISNHWSAAS